MIVDATLHSYSLRFRFSHQPGFDAMAFIELAASLGFSGVSLSLNDAKYRHLGGREPSRMDAVRRRLEELHMSLEIDTSGTDPIHMSELLQVARRMGARSIRTYTHHRGTIEEMVQATAHDLSQVMSLAKDLGVVVVLENHEDFTGKELARIVETVAHPHLKVLYDYGNSQMVLEDPEATLAAVLPHVYSVHVKDHVMVRPEDAGALMVAGVPIGEGFLPLRSLTAQLLEQGLRTFCFENVWAYRAPVQAGRVPLDGVTLGEGVFSFRKPPFVPAVLMIDQNKLSVEQLLQLETAALERGLNAFRAIFSDLGCDGRWRSKQEPIE